MALLNKVLGLPLRQEEVDFLIPDIDVDRKLGIDPFLLYRSPNPNFKRAHDNLIIFFHSVIELIRNDKIDDAIEYLQFPEPNEICLGYTAKGIGGSGVGHELAKEIVSVFASSPALLDRRLRHIEELQLVCPGIGPDRISDICANILKYFLIEYTQMQCEHWNIPVDKFVPVNHFFDFTEFSWRDAYFDLPRNPSFGGPLLFVPRRILRILPWINYDEYVVNYKDFFLGAMGGRRRKKLTLKKSEKVSLIKDKICEVTRADTRYMDLYVQRKEKDADKAQPHELNMMRDSTALKEEAGRLIGQLSLLSPGREDAYEYQDIVHRIINFCLHPHLVDGRPQERTIDGTLIRDIIYLNEGILNFWRYIQNVYNSLFIIFELKNKLKTVGTDIDQLSTYLGDPLGRFGILISRGGKNESFSRRKIIFNKDSSRKVILHLCDDDLINILNIRGSGGDTSFYIQNLYREFITKIE